MAIGVKLGQCAIYALLVLVPVTAILGAWLEGHPLTLLAVGNIQPWWIVRVPVAMTALGLLILGAAPQAQDLFVEFARPSLWRIAAIAAGSGLPYFLCHSSSLIGRWPMISGR
jgi:hypothetical protein